MHFTTIIVVPKELYLFEKKCCGWEDYISKKLEKYHTNYKLESYMAMTREEALKRYEGGENRYYSTIEKWIDAWEDKFDFNGNVISTRNKIALFDSYSIGEKFSDIQDNILPMREAINLHRWDRFIDKNGDYYEEKGKSFAEELLKESMDDYAVIINFHI